MATTPAKDISDYTYEELKAAADAKKEAKIVDVRKRLDESRELTRNLENELAGLTGVPVKKRGGRPPGVKNRSFVGKPKKKGGRRRKGGMTAKEAILSVIAKGPASSKDIITATKLNPGSINQALVLLKKSKEIKHDGKKGGKYSVGK